MLLRECTRRFLPTAHRFCVGEEDIGQSEGIEELLECLEDSLEVTAAERCLGLYPSYGEDAGEDGLVKIIINGAACLLQTQQNATIVVEKFLDLKISKVKINYDGLKTFERPGSVDWKAVVL